VAHPIPPPAGPPVQPRVPPYPGGSPTGGGGGAAGGGGVGAQGNPVAPSSFGGVYGTSQAVLYPCYNINSGQSEFRGWNPLLPPNDPILASSYTWKMEDIAAYRNPSLRTIIVTYKDLGVVQTVWSATAENQGQVQTQYASPNPATWGNSIPTGRIMATRLDIMISGQLIQLSVNRAAGAGPLAIIRVNLSIQVEEKTN
jgi:hypothetical protein